VTRRVHRGDVYDIKGSLEHYEVLRTIRIVDINLDQEDTSRHWAVWYKDNSMPLRWPRMNPMRVVQWEEAMWCIEAGYWEFVKRRPLGYLEQAQIRVFLLQLGRSPR
jgi:hypothetical protein